VQAIGGQPLRAPDGLAHHYERHRLEQTTAAPRGAAARGSFIAHIEASNEAELPRFIKDEVHVFLECGILAQFLRLRCWECSADKLLAFSCERHRMRIAIELPPGRC